MGVRNVASYLARKCASCLVWKKSAKQFYRTVIRHQLRTVRPHGFNVHAAKGHEQSREIFRPKHFHEKKFSS
jgi:hypothetical protein